MIYTCLLFYNNHTGLTRSKIEIVLHSTISKESGCKMKYSKVHCALLITTLLIGGVFFLSVLQPVSAQNIQPTPVPNVTDPAIPTLQAVVATQQVEIDQSQRDLKFETDTRELAVKNIEWEWGIAGLIAGVVLTILGTLGIHSVTDFKGKLDKLEKKLGQDINNTEMRVEKQLKSLELEIENRSQLNLNRILEKYDLANLPIQIPQGNGILRRRLELSALQHNEYASLEEIQDLSGVIVVKFVEPDDQKIFRSFVESHGPNPQKTAFVLFADPGSVEKDTIKCFENLVVANFPATVVSNILAIGRGLLSEER